MALHGLGTGMLRRDRNRITANEAVKAKRHRPFKIRRGYYNYRAYNVVKCGREWTVMNEDDSVAARTKTLRAMFRKIDGWWRDELRSQQREEREARRDRIIRTGRPLFTNLMERAMRQMRRKYPEHFQN